MKVVLLAVFGVLVCVSDSRAAAPNDNQWIRMKTTACYGTCPEFTLTVHFDGQVLYEGDHCVIRKDPARHRLNAATLEKLRNAIDESQFWTLPLDCCNCRQATDAPSTIIHVTKDATKDATTKIIDHYYGCRSAPESISKLSDQIISLTRAVRWIGSEEERSKQHWRRNGC